MAAKTGFETFTEVLKNMSPDHRQKLITSHQKFGALRGWCEAKGHIINLPSLGGLEVLKNTEQVKELKEVVDFLKPANFKWSYRNKSLQRKYKKSMEAKDQK